MPFLLLNLLHGKVSRYLQNTLLISFVFPFKNYLNRSEQYSPFPVSDFNIEHNKSINRRYSV